MKFVSFCRAALLALGMILVLDLVSADDYTIAEGNKSMLVAIGCFWCVEQAFEQYAPGVVEAVSGFAGGEMENPTYANHDGHYEVALVEYDPAKTSYEVLLNYAYRNMDPFDGTGQFCDKGLTYRPAIFYETEEEREIAEEVLAVILETKDWEMLDIKAPLLERPKFWKAGDYHQDYYLKNPAIYGYYKNACGRPKRLKDVWGLDEYECFHDESHACFNDYSGNVTALEDEEGLTLPGVINSDGVIVKAESNIKGAGAETAAPMPYWAMITTATAAVVVAFLIVVVVYRRFRKKDESEKTYDI